MCQLSCHCDPFLISPETSFYHVICKIWFDHAVLVVSFYDDCINDLRSYNGPRYSDKDVTRAPGVNGQLQWDNFIFKSSLPLSLYFQNTKRDNAFITSCHVSWSSHGFLKSHILPILTKVKTGSNEVICYQNTIVVWFISEENHNYYLENSNFQIQNFRSKSWIS